MLAGTAQLQKLAADILLSIHLMLAVIKLAESTQAPNLAPAVALRNFAENKVALKITFFWKLRFFLPALIPDHKNLFFAVVNVFSGLILFPLHYPNNKPNPNPDLRPRPG